MSYFNLSVENKRGDVLTLTNNEKYNVLSVDGLAPPTATVNTTTNATSDGATFNSSKINERNIVIQLAIEGDVEKNRIELYRYFKVKQPCKVLYKNGTRDIFINGYVESFECNFFEMKEVAQISILCPRPFFETQDEIDFDFASVTGLFEFPFSIDSDGIEFSELVVGEERNVVNHGDVETGMIIKFTAAGACTNPSIYNTETNEGIKVNVEMAEGDVLEINTNKGSKSITLNSDGVITNKINALDRSSTWLQLESGDNSLLYTADTNPDNLLCNLIYSSLYEGA